MVKNKVSRFLWFSVYNHAYSQCKFHFFLFANFCRLFIPSDFAVIG